jgi:outer membrane murein-binding lipoprotein Lpp
MRLSFAVVVIAVLLAGCTRQSDLDAANAKLAAANAAIETSNASLAAATKTIDDLKTQLAAAQKPNDQLDAQMAVKPRLPLAWVVRKAFLGPGLVVVLSTTVKEHIEVLATVRKPTLGTVKQVELNLDPSVSTNLGSSQGVVIDSGDVIILTNNNYSPSTITIR